MQVLMDHVVYLVHDLDEAAVRIGEALGVSFPHSGSHPHGTANRVCVFDDLSYIELLVARPGTPIAERVSRRLADRGEHIVRWAVRCPPEDIEGLADRLDLRLESGGVEREDGSTGTWTTATSANTDALGSPFLIAYSDVEERRERFEREPFADGRFTWVDCSGPSIGPWLGLIDGIEVRHVAGQDDRVVRVGAQIDGAHHVLPIG